jgi:transposase InsO family protein
MVGRILKHLKDSGKLVEPLTERRRRKRSFARPYAIRKPKGYRVRQPGDLVEVDTVDLRPLPGVSLSTSRAGTSCLAGTCWAFTAGPRPTRQASTWTNWWRARPSPSGRSRWTAARSSRRSFETACPERGIELFVLPPSSPTLNGCVERGNRTHREEFYEVYDLDWTVAGLRPDLLDWEGIYNTIRPHTSLGYLTPLEYITQWRLQRPRKEVVHSIT